MKQPFRIAVGLACAAFASVFTGCDQTDTGAESSNAASTAPQATQAGGTPQAAAATKGAVAKVDPTQNNNVHGTVTFTQEGSGLRVVADFTGLTPGDHGFHVHEKGDCSAPDGSSAGGHFNPGGHQHGAPDAAEHHIGDLGNVTADESGKAHIDRVFEFLTLSGTNSILNRSVIIHAAKDDLTSQPTGNAGGRVGCGVIQEAP